ncbi:MAG: aspartate dehydrogenase [Candidatus Bathyarchaeota archaeon]|nr:aspartate dehydrogenase [Candidatus Bathyarchaeota archaeon]
MKTVGIIGCGAIGTLIVEAAGKKIVPCDRLILFDRDVLKAEKLAKLSRLPTQVAHSLEEMIQLKPAVIVEAASQQAARQYSRLILSAGIELIVMSVGALLDIDLKDRRIHFPSGAIGGLDALAAARLADVAEVILTSRKNPRTLDLDNRAERVVFEGSAKEAVDRFPREMNVAAALALTVGLDRVKVRVVSDPKVQRNVHEVQVKWRHGDMLLKFSNDPHPDNPKTSALAAWSAIALLKEILEKK